ncbi:MAG: hypothetical protein R2746_09245 [Acidimicrobiales bacterium]
MRDHGDPGGERGPGRPGVGAGVAHRRHHPALAGPRPRLLGALALGGHREQRHARWEGVEPPPIHGAHEVDGVRPWAAAEERPLEVDPQDLGVGAGTGRCVRDAPERRLVGVEGR